MNVRLQRFNVDQFEDISSSFNLDEGEQVIAVEWDTKAGFAAVTTIRPWHSAEYLDLLEDEHLMHGDYSE